MAKGSKFREIENYTPLSSGMDRISQYQLYQRGVDTRSGNLTVSDTSFPRVLLGNQLGAGVDFYGMKVSKPGYDVNTATDDQLIFNSSQNTFKVVDIGTVTLPTYTVTRAAGWGLSSVAIPPNATVAHGATGTPIVFAYLRATGPNGVTLVALPYTDSGVVGAAAYFHSISLAVNETYLEIGESTLTNGDVGVLTHGGGTIEYWILQETAS